MWQLVQVAATLRHTWNHLFSGTTTDKSLFWPKPLQQPNLHFVYPLLPLLSVPHCLLPHCLKKRRVPCQATRADTTETWVVPRPRTKPNNNNRHPKKTHHNNRSLWFHHLFPPYRISSNPFQTPSFVQYLSTPTAQPYAKSRDAKPTVWPSCR